MQKDKFPFILIVLLIAISLGAGWWLTKQNPSQMAGADDTALSGDTTQSGTARIGGDFTLVNQNGESYSSEQLKGQHALVFFGFTHCPDICPMGLSTITNALDSLPETTATQITPVFISVDPARDTPARMKEYAENFHPSLVALTGDEAAIAQTADAFKVFYRKAEVPADAEGNYMVNHSGYIYLMGPDGEYLRHFTSNDQPEKLADAIRDAVGGTEG